MLEILYLRIFGLINMVVCLAVLLYEVHSLIGCGYYLVAVVTVLGEECNTDTCLDIYRYIGKL